MSEWKRWVDGKDSCQHKDMPVCPHCGERQFVDFYNWHAIRTRCIKCSNWFVANKIIITLFSTEEELEKDEEI